MKNKITAVSRFSITFLFALLLTQISFAQFTTRKDPANPKRTIIEYKQIVRTTPVIKPQRNVLDDEKVRRPAIPFKPFELRNPRTNKAIDPNKMMTIKLKNGQQRSVSAKQYFDELNAMEQALSQRGMTLRVPATFTRLRPNFTRGTNYISTPKLKNGFNSGSFSIYTAKPTGLKYARSSVLKNVAPSPFKLSAGMPPIVIGTNTGNSDIRPIGNGSKTLPITTIPGVNPGTLKALNFNAGLFVAVRFENHGQPEFPAEWKKETWISPGRKIFPILVQVPKGLEGLIKRIDWQASKMPFDNTLKDVNVPGIEQSGTMSPAVWAEIYRGVPDIPGFKNNKYAALYVNLTPETEHDKAEAFFVRAICYDASGEVLKVTDQVLAYYGGKTEQVRIAPTTYNTVPGFNYSFPEGNNIPFGVFIKGSGLSTIKTTEYKAKEDPHLYNKGFRVYSNASLGVKYFNFESLINDNVPLANELTLVEGVFKGVMGKGTGPGNTDESLGISLNLSFLNGKVKYPAIDFTTPVPGIPNSVSLEYDVVQPLDMQLLDMWFTIGPVPIHIAAGITGEAGLKLYGQARLDNFEMTGSIKPFLNTRFDASGGVDALIAYATLNAEVNPLLSIELPLTFSSTGKAVSFNTNLSGLAGRVFLKIGFFYPCPDLEKIVGWLTGDEETPLCECVWEYNIFDFPGFSHSYSY